MPITERQREARRKHIGGTDIHKILFGNALDVYHEKVSDLAPIVPNDAMELGTMLERGIMDMAESRLGKIKRSQPRRVEGTPILTNIDGIVSDTGVPVEVKTAGIVSEFTPTHEWGDQGTDAIPDPYIVQAHAHMMATDQGTCHIAAVIGGRGFCMFVVQYNSAIGDVIVRQCKEFWDMYVKRRVPPGDEWNTMCAPTMDIAKRMRRVPKKIVPIDPKFLEAYDHAKALKAWLTKTEETIKCALLDQLGDAEASEVMPDDRQVTYFEQPTGGIDLKRFRRDHPKLAAEYANPATHRVMRTTTVRKELTV